MAEHKWADVLRAIADGKEVQWRSVHMMGHWNELSVGYYSPITNPHLEWRIKPEPKPDVVRWVNSYGTTGHATKHAADINQLSECLGQYRLTFDGETGRLKSAEVLP